MKTEKEILNDKLFDKVKNNNMPWIDADWNDIEKLIEDGADPEVKDNALIKKIAFSGNMKALTYTLNKIKINDSLKEQILNYASGEGYLEFVKYFVENGINYFNNNNEPTMRAALRGQIKVVKYLIENGVEVEDVLNNKSKVHRENIEKNVKLWLIRYKEIKDFNNSLNNNLNKDLIQNRRTKI